MNQTETRLRFEVQQDRLDATEWRVEAIDYDEDGAVCVAIFSGLKARERAEEYAAFKNPGRLVGVSVCWRPS